MWTVTSTMSESRTKETMTASDRPAWLPAYIDPAVLRPGQSVIAVLDKRRTPLTVVRVEPVLTCRTPTGDKVTLFAHEVEVVND
jgi:hypothetical protein